MPLEATAAAHSDQHGHVHGPSDEPHNDIVYPAAIPFVLVHLAALGVFWTGFTTQAVVLGVSLYLVRMWALTGVYHRYFSHRSYKTSRIAQFFLALLGQTSAQRGVLWWAAIHRHHHRHSDTPEDVHSPKHAGFLFSHVLWIFSPQKNEADYSLIQDFAKYPELRLLDRFPYFPPFLLAVAGYWFAGWPGLFVGFFLSTVVLYHAVFSINSVAHVVGTQRYVTGDDSRNNWWLALITLGEGWHNNHHHYQSSTRQGFFWWEIDVTYYILKALSSTGLVWDLRSPPESVRSGEQRLGRKVIEQVAREVAGTFSVESIAGELSAAWEQRPALKELAARVQKTRDDASASLQKTRAEALAHLQDLHLPEVPSFDEIRNLVAKEYVDSPSLDEIAVRAREILIERLVQHLGPKLQPTAA